MSYVLWPIWPKAAVRLDAPAVPVTVADVLFNVPPAAIRAAVQRHPGAHERIDLVFLWPSLAPPQADGEGVATPAVANEEDAVPMPKTDDRLFVTISGLGTVLAPAARLRTIYPRYIEAVSYTHLDVYKRQACACSNNTSGSSLRLMASSPRAQSTSEP